MTFNSQIGPHCEGDKTSSAVGPATGGNVEAEVHRYTKGTVQYHPSNFNSDSERIQTPVCTRERSFEGRLRAMPTSPSTFVSSRPPAERRRFLLDFSRAPSNSASSPNRRCRCKQDTPRLRTMGWPFPAQEATLEHHVSQAWELGVELRAERRCSSTLELRGNGFAQAVTLRRQLRQRRGAPTTPARVAAGSARMSGSCSGRA